MRIDSHHHFWNPERRNYYWMTGPEMAPIRRPMTPGDLRPWLEKMRIDRTIVVQTIPSLDETRELLATAGTTDFVGGVVGWVDLTEPDTARSLAALKAGPSGCYLLGIRHQIHDEPDPQWIMRSDVLRGIAEVGRAGLVYDLLPKEPELPACIECVRRNPGMSFVIDHIAKPRIAEGALNPWSGLMAEIAAFPNVSCKLSGMVTEADWANWNVDTLQPYVARVIELFGPERVMFGSDWPICLLAAKDYTQVAQTLEDILADLVDPELIDKTFGLNASRIYGVAALADVVPIGADTR